MTELPPQLTPTPRSGAVGRYAPSPTGALHLGNLRTALLAWRQIRELGGTFILRIEDIDGPRTVPGAEEQLIDDLRWLGIDWDEGPDIGGPAGPYRQSEREAIYEAALEALERRGLTYLCTCSRKDLREASAPHGPEGVIYPGTCRRSDAVLQREHPLGASVRFGIEAAPIIDFIDELAGRQRHDLRELCGDFVIRRRDRLWAYQLACALDDALMGVTHVLRGEDLITSTPRQIALLQALGLPVPKYCHVPLVADAHGERMAKRDASAGLHALREAGLTPEEACERIMHAPLMAGEQPV